MKYRRTVTFLMLAAGIIFLAAGAGCLYELYQASRHYERTTGVVRRYQSKRIYRNRKIRYENDMTVCFPTKRYGEVGVALKSYNPFRKKGDELPVWYHPDRPREVLLPRSEMGWGGFFTVCGLIGICGGLAALKKQ